METEKMKLKLEFLVGSIMLLLFFSVSTTKAQALDKELLYASELSSHEW